MGPSLNPVIHHNIKLILSLFSIRRCQTSSQVTQQLQSHRQANHPCRSHRRNVAVLTAHHPSDAGILILAIGALPSRSCRHPSAPQVNNADVAMLPIHGSNASDVSLIKGFPLRQCLAQSALPSLTHPDPMSIVGIGGASRSRDCAQGHIQHDTPVAAPPRSTLFRIAQWHNRSVAPQPRNGCIWRSWQRGTRRGRGRVPTAVANMAAVHTLIVVTPPIRGSHVWIGMPGIPAQFVGHAEDGLDSDSYSICLRLD